MVYKLACSHDSQSNTLQHMPFLPRLRITMNPEHTIHILLLVSCGLGILASILRLHRVHHGYKESYIENIITPIVSQKYRKGFLVGIVLQTTSSVGVGVTFMALALQMGDPWFQRTSSSVVLSSMLGQVREILRHTHIC